MNQSYSPIYEALQHEILACRNAVPGKEIECRFKIAEVYFGHICRIAGQGFSSIDEEISFFRQTKPLFLLELLYWQLIYHFFLFCRPDSEIYLNLICREKRRLPQLAHHHGAFVLYMLSENHELDKRYFTTSNPVCIQPLPLYYGGPQPYSSHDLVLASWLALRRYDEFLDQQLNTS